MNNKLKVLIVDDEELARIGLKLMLEKFQTVEVVGEASNIISAVEACITLKPNVIFLDIGFPGESGFDLLDKIDDSAKIVFVTAFDEFAIRAFEVNACDYLLKPVSTKRLEQTIKRLELDAGTIEPTTSLFNYDDRIFIALNYKYYFVKINEILRISASDKYSELYTTYKLKGLVKKTLQEWENCLPNKQFVRIHRSTIVNINFIDKIIKDSHSSYILYLKGSEENFVISRRYISKLKNYIKR
ncbi:MAG: LytTR family DNA-binding domain-containing protein [bacterium]